MRLSILLILSVFLFSGCGQKGPLYLPDDVKQAHAAEVAAEQAAAKQEAEAAVTENQ